MAKFKRFDPRNKKADTKKRKSKEGNQPKRIHRTQRELKEIYDEKVYT